jgi:hypothetical protein
MPAQPALPGKKSAATLGELFVAEANEAIPEGLPAPT